MLAMLPIVGLISSHDEEAAHGLALRRVFSSVANIFHHGFNVSFSAD
jgi:hypothetical protein